MSNTETDRVKSVDTVYAAGTICWRPVKREDGSEKIMVLLIHRKKQRDVSFPKGKLDPGESLPQTAVRETHEETGLRVGLGPNLGTINYSLPDGRAKVVQYWAAKVSEEAVRRSDFVPGKEVAALEWVSIKKARDLLSYAADRELLEIFRGLVKSKAHDSFAIVMMRHAEAAPRGDGFAVDSERPLTPQGETDATFLVPTLQAFAPRRVYTSDARRCRETVTPLVGSLGIEPRADERLSQDAWENGDTAGIRAIVGKAVRRTKNVLLCSHRPVLPEIAREIALATGSLPGDYLTEAASLPPGGFSVFHISRLHPGAGIVAVEVYPLDFAD